MNPLDEERKGTCRVLVAYATKHGATGGIAERIGEVVQTDGWDAEVLPVNRVGDLAPYQAVILGSAVYFGKWVSEAARFLEQHENELSKRPVWLFSSGPTGEGDPMVLMKGWCFPEALKPLAGRIGVRDFAFFHGALDPKALNILERLAIRAVKAPAGDFRNWEAIDSWAKRIVTNLRQEETNF